jgi:uncharacterized ferritin-like protein (DUF455 family)
MFPKYISLAALLCVVGAVFFSTPVKSAGDHSLAAAATPTPVKKPGASANTNKKLPAGANTNSNKNSNAAKPAATPKPELSKVIVSTTAARVRSEASTTSTEIRRIKLGTVLPVLEKTTAAAPWYKVQLPAGSKAQTGWMSSTVAGSFDPAKSETTYRQLAAKNFKKTGMSFSDSSEVHEFLDRVTPEIKSYEAGAELGLKRLQALAAALDAIPTMKSEEKQYKDFTAAHDKEIVYSDPAGQWFVRSNLLWDLRKKYPKSALAEEIAWTAARTPLPGECEGYVNCYLYLMRETDGEYLSLYPGGKHAPEALKNITTYLQPIVADLKEKKIYTGPSDLSDRAEYNRLLAGLRNVISRLPLVDKDRPLKQINQLAEGYK